MYKAVLFDLDGTLLDSLQDLAKASNYVCRLHGWPEHPLEAYRYFVGNGIPMLCRRFSPQGQRDTKTQAQVVAEFQAYYSLHKQDTTGPYPGITLLLKALQREGISYGVVTNKEHTLAQAIAEYYFPGEVKWVQGATPSLPTKPDPAGMLQLMNRMQAEPDTTLFVGDSDVDIYTARNAGIDSCGVLWGFRSQEELSKAGAVHLARDVEQLAAVVGINL